MSSTMQHFTCPRGRLADGTVSGMKSNVEAMSLASLMVLWILHFLVDTSIYCGFHDFIWQFYCYIEDWCPMRLYLSIFSWQTPSADLCLQHVEEKCVGRCSQFTASCYTVIEIEGMWTQAGKLSLYPSVYRSLSYSSIL